jgi:HEAT repeat protein
MTLARAVDGLKSAQPRELRPLLKFLMDAPVTEEPRGAVVAAVKPLLNDIDAGPMAFEVFARWADKEQIPELIEFVRVAPNSPRGKEAMKLLSRMGDTRAAEPLAACLTDFSILRDAKAALAALGGIAKPAVLPYYHHADRHARDAARELLRGYHATEEETFAETIKALGSASVESRRSAMDDLAKAKLTPERQAAASRALRPLVTDGERAVSDGARNAMKALASPADADFMLGLLGSTDDATRQFATDLLVKFKDARAAKPIAVLLSDSMKTYPAGKALVALGSAAEPAVIPYLGHDDPNTRKRAAEVLAEIGTSASLPALQRGAKDKNFFAKVAAERALNAIKSRHPGGRR